MKMTSVRFVVTAMLIAVVTSAATAADTDEQRFLKGVGKSASLAQIIALDGSRAVCVCQDGSSVDHLAGILLALGGVIEEIDGILTRGVFMQCVVLGFDDTGAINANQQCLKFTVLPKFSPDRVMKQGGKWYASTVKTILDNALHTPATASLAA